ncbi:TIM44-like domain-containing protein [Ideonella sp. DXS22W]|uniref:TIM44-like domain-containing protein n=1 Tax=Pseudaquabacterium inlustre TaxID=2984192 RepID=A0ABU9CM75_9BURK
MKKLLLTLSMAVAVGSLGMAPHFAEAKRLGSGKPAGLQRQMPATPAKPATPPTPAQAPGAQPAGQQAAPAMAGATAAAAAAPAKRSWMGPLAGLAAGIGLAALFSHFGMGEGLANFVMIALLAVAAFALLRFVLGRLGAKRQPAASGMGSMGNLGLAGAGAGAGSGGGLGAGPAMAPSPAQPVQATPMTERSSLADPVGAASTAGAGPLDAPAAAEPALPAGIDRDDFIRLAKMVFVRMQAANDAGNVDDLRKFTTPELFASLRVDLQERGAAKQQTDVVQLDATIADVTRDGMGQDVVSVRYSGLIREEAERPAEPFAELWHLVRPVGGEWAIAGITPLN